MASPLTTDKQTATVSGEHATGADDVTPQEMKRIRKKLGLSVAELGRACGHTGKTETVNTTIRRYEAGMKPVPATMERLLMMFDLHGVPPEFLVSEQREGGDGA